MNGVPRIFHPRSLAAVLGLVFAMHPPAWAEEPAALTVHDVLARHVEAKGGRQAWQAVDSLRLKGTYGAFGNSAPFTLDRQRPFLYRFETATPEGERWLSARGSEGIWTIDPWMGTPWAVEMNTVDAAVLAPETDFDGPLFDPAAKGHRVELAGIVDFDGEEAYELVVTRGDGGVEEWYLSTGTFLEVARIAPASDFGQPVEVGKTYFMDFQSVGGLMLAHRIEKEYGIRFRSFDVESVEINPELPADHFLVERTAQMQALAPLVGSWEVKVEWAFDPQGPWTEVATEAEVDELFHGSLLQTQLNFDHGGRPARMLVSWSWDRFRELYLETVFDAHVQRHDLLQGKMEDGRLVTSNLETGTFLDSQGRKVHSRHTTYDVGPEGFKVLRESSVDGGETWRENLRLTFSRRP